MIIAEVKFNHIAKTTLWWRHYNVAIIEAKTALLWRQEWPNKVFVSTFGVTDLKTSQTESTLHRDVDMLTININVAIITIILIVAAYHEIRLLNLYR